ncbi:MAG: putative NADPH-quinone reductase [Planctomycetota bacterium]|jgi:putative NADPH-quinone reductase
MSKRITIIQGQPDPDRRRLAYALASAYRHGAEIAGYEVREIVIAYLDFPILRTQKELTATVVSDAIRFAQEAIRWADHLVVIYPLWLGTMPALLKAFMEQVFRPGNHLAEEHEDRMPSSSISRKSARIIVTMGTSVFFYRWFLGSHSLKSLERNILSSAGIGPVRETLFGSVERANEAMRGKWLETMETLGQTGN